MSDLATTDEPGTPLPPPTGRWTSIAWLACCVIVVAALVGLWLRVDRDLAGADLGAAIIAGERPVAPALPTTRLAGSDAPGLPDWYQAADGRQQSSADGEVLVVNWWASWCGPCLEEAPELREIAEDYEGRVTVVGLNAGFEDLESDARGFVADQELRFPIVRGIRADKDAWGVGGYPETFVVGVDGRVSAHVNGPIDGRQLRELLDRELAEERT